ncbi:MAG: AAA family ATPase [Micropepsaceae bacterium]
MLVILSGLPGTGKTTIARELARKLGAVHLRIDTIEQALRDKGLTVVDEGYRVAYALAEDNLRLGLTVIADSVNPLQLTREAWRDVASRAGTRSIDVEIICSDEAEHRRRVETREADIANHQLPTWDDVIAREYHAWSQHRLIVDTVHMNLKQASDLIVSTLA